MAEVEMLSSSEPGRAARRCRRCRPMRSSSCRCATSCCSPAWCCRSRSAGRTRSPPRSRRCANSAQVGILHAARRRAGGPGADRLHRVGTVANIVRYVTAPDGTHHLVCQGEQRFQVIDFLDGLAVLRRARCCGSPSRTTRTPEIEARFLHLRRQAVEALRAAAAGAAGAGRRRAGRHVARAAGRSRRRLHGHQARGEAGNPRDDRRRRAHGQGLAPAGRSASKCLRLSQEIGRQTKAALDERQREVLLREQMAAIQRQLGEGEDGKAAEIAELNEAIAKAACRKRSRSRRARNCAGCERMPEAAAEYGMVRTYLDWLIELPWSAARGEADRHRRGAAHPRRGPLRARQDQAPHPRISRGAQAQAARQGADPLLRRPARRRQDLARPVDRARDGPQVRAGQPRRRARRGGNPRPPPHLYRRAARQHHPGNPQGRRAQLRDDARRDRQARRRHPGRSRRRRCSKCSTPSRTAPSATTISACRSICPGSCSSPPPTCSTPSRARCATAWRSSASPATPRKRSCRSRGAIWCGASSRPTA